MIRWTYRPKKNVGRKGYCEVVPCDQRAVAFSLAGLPVCLRHGYSLGGFTLAEGFEGLMDFEPRGPGAPAEVGRG